jgi:hypothetical protein
LKSPRPILIIAAVALLPVLLYAHGYGGQDFAFHLASWLDMRAAWHHLQLLPTWAPHANFTLGDPHLGFYPPVSLLLGALLTSILPPQLAPAAFIWIALTLAGLAMYHASAPFVAQTDRLPAAILYLLSPYLLATALVRFAVAELIVQAILPLILLALYRCLWNPGIRATPILAALLGLAWLTNIPASIVLLYTFTLLAILIAIRRRTLAPILHLALAEALALSLAALRLLPTWAERHLIQQASLIAVAPRGYLLFMPQAPFPFGVLMYVFWTLYIGVILLLAACLVHRSRPLASDHPALTWTSLAAIAFFFQFPLSWPLWTFLPQLVSVQYPFRFQPFEGAALALLLFAPATRRTLRKPIYAAVSILCALPLLLFLSIQNAPASQPNRHLSTLITTLHSQGYKGAPEYVPTGAPAPPPPQQRTPPATSNPGCILTQSPSNLSFLTDSLTPCPILLPVFFYPYWQARDETNNPIPTTSTPEGLLLLTAPPGRHTITLTFRPASRLRTTSSIISLIALLLLGGLLLSLRRQPHLLCDNRSRPA